jgi:hypothetical protein
MIARAALLVVLLAAASPQAHAQRTPERVRPPRALLERLLADADHPDELGWGGLDSLATRITVERRDFNGDGVREWVVEGTSTCGSNCERWIYRRLPGGRFVQVYAGFGTGITMLPGRSHGWRTLTEFWHMSCCAGSTSTYVFDGRRYQWRDKRYQVWDEDGQPRTTYHLFVTPPEGPRPQRLVLDPYDAGGGLWISARYDVCRAGRARTDVCGAPRLVLSSARLPPGRVCVRMRAGAVYPRGEYRSRPGGGWCGVTAPDAQARGRRRLVLRPRREDWGRLRYYAEVELTGPGLPGTLQTDDAHGLTAFAGRLDDHYWLPCIEDYGCVGERQRRR